MFLVELETCSNLFENVIKLSKNMILKWQTNFGDLLESLFAFVRNILQSPEKIVRHMFVWVFLEKYVKLVRILSETCKKNLANKHVKNLLETF